MHGFEYYTAADEIALEEELQSFYNSSKKPKLLEVFTPSRQNDDILLDYFKFIK